MTTRALTSVFSVVLLAGMLAASHGQMAPVDDKLLERFRSEDLQTRAAAIPEAVPELLKRVWAEDMSLHHRSLQALREAVWRATGDVFVEDRAPLAAALVKAASDASLPVAARCEALELASLVASSPDVPQLARLLTDPDVQESARMCLVQVAFRAPQAAGVLRTALASAPPERQVALINGLAAVGAEFAEPAVRSWLNSPVADVRLASIRALGSIGDARTADALWQIAEKASDGERSAAVDSVLRIAESLSPDEARPVYEKVYTHSRSPVEKCAGLAGIARTRGPGAVPLLTQSLMAKERDVRGLAEELLAEMPGAAVSLRLAESMAAAPVQQQAAIAQVLGRREDAPSALALIRAASSSESAVRAAAFSALAQMRAVSRAEVARLLAERLPQTQASEERLALLSAAARVAHPSLLAPLMKDWEAGGREPGLMRAMLAVARSVADAGRTDEALRVFLLVAGNATERSLLLEAAGNLRDAASRREFAAAAGFVMRWWTLGPFKGREQWTARDAFPVDALVVVPGSVTVEGQEFVWKPAPVESAIGELDLSSAVGEGDDLVCYALAEIISPSVRDAVLRLGSDDGVIVHLNGRKVHEFTGERNYAVDEDSVPVTLQEGLNILLCKVLNAGGGWSVGVRVVDTGGRPLRLEQRRP